MRCLLIRRKKKYFLFIYEVITWGKEKKALLISTAYSRVHETPNLDWKAEFRFAESRFSQPLYK